MGFIGTVEQYHSKDTIKLALKNGADANALIPLDKFFNESLPELRTGSKFYLHPLLFNGNLQTLYLNTADYSKTWNVQYGRRIINFDHNGSIHKGGSTTADFVLKSESKEEFDDKFNENPPPEDWPKQHPGVRFLNKTEISNQNSDDTKPMVIICHGLGGGSHEPIIRCISEELHKRGFETVVLNSRGCARTKISTPELFYGLQTDDLRSFVKLLRTSYPNRPFYAIGSSFGATILSNFLGEEGDKSDFVAAATLSNPWDMTDSTYRISSSFISRKLFLPAITSTLTRLVKSNRDVLLEDEFFSKEKIYAKYNSTPEFDDAFTAPLYGFNTAFDYYRHTSSSNRLPKIQTPLLIINSTDDPTVGVVSIPIPEVEANPYLILAKTNIGGHLAYLKSDLKSSWAVDRIADFFSKFNKEIETSKKPIVDYSPKTPYFLTKK
ncbi:hypothetical protein WICMUC_000940 [Wickerhamomyces mucosus]|uniref:AB hydrolase-1 domain-containing protein n=1 Tax=Wickerhamomyces mucosus TaxID=1378264 RepID=A0A9P8PXP3_9ASCO|nr:hypothetical protein WICMUC_000940 [Wickerhamomyces mucosus]